MSADVGIMHSRAIEFFNKGAKMGAIIHGKITHYNRNLGILILWLNLRIFGFVVKKSVDPVN